MPRFDYGGQAVIEGVMMRGPRTWSVAVRRPDNNIDVEKWPVTSVTERWRFLKWPFVRGTVVLVESMVLGIQALSFSAAAAVGEDERPLNRWELAGTILVALGLAVALFVFVPAALAHLARSLVAGSLGQNIIEGLVRVAVFLAYVAGVGLIPDIRRVFAYHGAEHKVINAYEAGAGMDVAAVRPYPVLHPRCGTSFLLIVLIISIVVFSFLAVEPLWWRLTSRLLLLPVVAGLGYEFIKFTARYAAHPACRCLIAPGLWLQRLTTREPDDGQIEVAIRALDAVLAKEGEVNVR
ncbi:MAG: DUF1385 domain-containing protein [Desulfotomaculales bacterium]